MSGTIDLRGVRRTAAEWDAVVTQVLDTPDLGRLDLTGAEIEAEQLAAVLAAVPPGCVVAREVAATRTSCDLGREYRDWDKLWAFVEPVFLRWQHDLVELADRLEDEALSADLLDDAHAWGADREGFAQEVFDGARSGGLPRLIAAAEKVPAIAAYLRRTLDQVESVYGACFEGAVGNDFVYSVAAWADLVPPLAGAIRCWRGDGGDAPVWDRELGDEIRRLAG